MKNGIQDDLPQRFLKSVTKEGLILSNEKILVAFSGGADSVALLSVLKKISSDLNLKIFAAHLNHGIRGIEADRDEDFCRNICQKMDVPFESRYVSVPEEAKRTGQGLEACARKIRYDFLFETAEKFKCNKIATAHHADDNIETVLLHIIRGTGLKGLVGIPPKRGNIIRPLLIFRKKELIKYLENEGLDFVYDSTNSDLELTRNKIRHKLLSTVYEINPRADTAFSNMSKLVEEDNKFLTTLAEGINKKATLSELKSLPLPLLSRFLQIRFFECIKKIQLNGEEKNKCLQLSFIHLTPVIDYIKNGKGNASFALPGKITAHISSAGAHFLYSEEEKKQDFNIPLKMGENNISQCLCKILITNDKNVADEWQNIYKLSILVSVNFDTIIFGKEISLFARNSKSGDSYVYNGHTRNVRRKLIDLKIPSHLRKKIPCICDSDGIIFVPNLKIADRVKPVKGKEKLYIVYTDVKNPECFKI